jgi:DNA-binding CsgD family transcriptional regulator
LRIRITVLSHCTFSGIITFLAFYFCVLCFRKRLAVQWEAVSDRAHVVNLSARQEEVLSLVCLGLANKEIAARLGLSICTVKWYLKQLLLMTGASNRTLLAVMASPAFLRGVALPSRSTTPFA